jgi:hypothetical protein
MLFYVFIVLYRSMYCLCVNVYYCHRVTTQLQLTNISYKLIENSASCFSCYKDVEDKVFKVWKLYVRVREEKLKVM